jgi:hypothetical protein
MNSSLSPALSPALPPDLPTFAAFWPHYLDQHRHPGCRALHYGAAAVAATLVLVAACARCPWTLSAAPLAAYALAWLGHALVERNRPATWSHPWWSLRAEFRMVRLALTGRLRGEWMLR